MLEGVDGAGVFLGVGEAAMIEDAGDGLDVDAVAQQVGAAAVEVLPLPLQVWMWTYPLSRIYIQEF